VATRWPLTKKQPIEIMLLLFKPSRHNIDFNNLMPG